MTRLRPERASLAALTSWVGGGPRRIEDAARSVDIRGATRELCPATKSRLLGASVLIRTPDQLSAALALLSLDGLARRLILCPPDLEAGHLPSLVRDAEVDFVVGSADGVCDAPTVHLDLSGDPAQSSGRAATPTDWVLFTSGTTGRPKMVVHTLEGLLGALPQPLGEPPVWGTFYDIRRYGGLQMLLRAFTGGGSMILSSPNEGPAAFLARLAAGGATHVAGTPSHWRRALLAEEIRRLRPRYARLSGEIADQAILDRLKAVFPGIPVVHAYASTEGGVGFEVTDGLEGFPIELLTNQIPKVEMKVQEGSLRVRSSRTATRFIDDGAPALHDEEGFVDTGDLLEARDGRYYFLGRRGGVINVGGQKVHPEEVEAILNRQPGVRVSRVHARRNPVTGAIVAAEVVAESWADPRDLEAALRAACAAALPPYKSPAVIRFVETLDVTAGGKLKRSDA